MGARWLDSGSVCFSGGTLAASLAPSHMAWVALGANLGDASRVLGLAAYSMAALPWTQWQAGSSLYRSRPVDSVGPDYTNAVIALQTALGPMELLHALQAIEGQHGRERPYRNAPRTLDLDLIWHGGHARNNAELTLPHPRYLQRAFVIEPLAEVINVLNQGRVTLLNPVVWAPELPEISARLALTAAQGIEKTNEIWLETGAPAFSRR